MTNKLDNTTLLGDKLKQEREAAKLTVGEIAAQTKIPEKYLQLLEDGKYEKLPADVYVRGFLEKYAKILGVPKEDLIKDYFAETEELNKIRSKKNIVPVLKSPRFVVTPRIMAVCLGVIVIFAILVYFGWQMVSLVRPPGIVLSSPASDFIANLSKQSIEGTALRANILTINGKAINIKEDGSFSDVLNLSEGLNVIELKAKSVSGKETTMVRKVIYDK